MIVRSKTNKSHYSNIPLYEPSREEKKNIISILMSKCAFLSYQKLKTKYACYCSWCNEYNIYTPIEVKQIRAAKVCPKCMRNVRTTPITETTIREFITIGRYGYRVSINWQFNKKPKITNMYQCLYTDGSEVAYRKGIVRNMYSLGESYDKDHWHKCDTYKYLGYFYSYKQHENWFYKVNSTKKRVYENYKLPEMKSNQEKLIKDNLFNENQIYYILNFDLKTVEEVLKYNSYISKHEFKEQFIKPLNIHYLKYLYKNKIDINDFDDYMKDCNLLNIKLDKPKNFMEKHIEVASLAKEKLNKGKNRLVKKRFKELSSKIYEKGNMVISPFKTFSEIIKTGDLLNNCISGYIDDYAKKKTDLYYLAENDKKLACIEIKNNKLIQAREFNNISCKKKIIKDWCRINHFTY